MSQNDLITLFVFSFKEPMKRNWFVAYFKVYLSKLKIPKSEILSIKIGHFTSVFCAQKWHFELRGQKDT